VTRIGELGTTVVLSLLILVILMMEVTRPSKTLILTTAALHNIPEDGILHSHRCENLKSYYMEFHPRRLEPKNSHLMHENE
jgi:hypothetical protein